MNEMPHGRTVNPPEAAMSESGTANTAASLSCPSCGMSMVSKEWHVCGSGGMSMAPQVESPTASDDPGADSNHPS